ncbi:hypothetical protein TRIATDRAFT_289759, partial [Trichoderma atroviride IMI 206040]
MAAALGNARCRLDCRAQWARWKVEDGRAENLIPAWPGLCRADFCPQDQTSPIQRGVRMNWGCAEDAWLPKRVVLQAPVELRKTCSPRHTPSSSKYRDFRLLLVVPWAEVPPREKQGPVLGL